MQLEHPAIIAWRQLGPTHGDPDQTEVFEAENRHTTIYRLGWTRNASTSVIAKRSWYSTARVERTVYEEILPKLPFPTIHYYGSIQESNGEFWWLFLEDVSSEEMYTPQIQEHRVVAAQWLGIMNTSASDIGTTTHLPERTPDYYLSLLLLARENIISNLENPALKVDDLALMKSVLAQCDHLSANWNQLALACKGMPETLVHGDFIKKNVRIRHGREGIIILPFDWEKAGWGIPAEDISRVDLLTYWLSVHDYWPNLTVQTLKRIISVGKVFRCLVFLDWITPSLGNILVEKPIAEMKRCKTWLDNLIQEAGWQN